MIIKESYKFNDYIHLVDIKQFGRAQVTSVFIAEFDNDTVIFDPGSSLDIRKLLRYMKRNQISLESVKYIIATHYHFDHSGGLWKLYENIKVKNPDVKIVSSKLTKIKLENFENESHFQRSKKSFGPLMGELKKVDDIAFLVLKPNHYFKNNLNIDIFDSFTLNSSEIKLGILKSPGHSPDHICPFFVRNGKIDFMFLCEAAGSFTNSEELITLPSSAAPDFQYNQYLKTLNKIKELSPLSIGYGHFGAVIHREDVDKILKDNIEITKRFRKLIIKYYKENPKTRYIADKFAEILVDRTGLGKELRGVLDDNGPIAKMGVTLIYGMLIDLGYRN